jgi:probable F420-dependent oxidoreductase
MAAFDVALGTFGAQNLFDGTPASLVRLARAADAAGIDQITFTDHVIMGERTDRYPYGRFPVPPEHPWFEPITLMGAISSVTSRIRLSTGVLIAPLRPAALLAKQLATLDLLSNGRIDLGVGVGWQREEYQSQGLDFEKRWSLLDDQLQAVQTLWREAPATHHGASIHFDRLYSLPHPAQTNGVPLWFGVAPTPRQARRIAQFGDGWIPIANTPDVVRQGCELIREAFANAGRDPRSLKVRAHARLHFPDASGQADWARAVDSAHRLAEVGATVIEFEIVPLLGDVAALDEFLARLVALKNA